ncbi:MAG: ribonuclease J [Actinomycetota bacterium]|jgi:ribonuclease J|nr:ribonuclease J [Actinomycetota bacterium]
MPAPFRITFLGGLGEIGRNCAVLETAGKMLILDCGILFPDADSPGVDLVLPDFTYLRDNAERVVGCIATHGHEDHVGALGFLLRDLSFPIFGSRLTLGLARNRIEEAGLTARTEFIAVQDGERRQIGPFDVEFVPVTHSVPHGFATVVRSPQGVVLHSGDLKLDLNPIDGRRTDLARIGGIAKNEGIRLYLGDSTNADEPGHSRSESTVGPVLNQIFAAQAGRRIITTCFASHIHRVQQIADAALAHGRTIATLGRSMKQNVALARSLGILRIPDDKLIDISQIDRLDPRQVCIISTGSQGEPRSALALMATESSKWLTVGPTDTVILSSHPIPGNENNVSRVLNGLVKLGAEVVHSGIHDVHATGHAKQEELKTLLNIIQPEWFVPVHGEYRHLAAHARLAATMGVADGHTLICEDGQQVTLDDNGLRYSGKVPSGHLYVDGSLDDVGAAVLRDRKTLSEEGILVVLATVDFDRHELIDTPQVITRGWVHTPDADALLTDCAETIRDALTAALETDTTITTDTLQRTMRRSAGQFVQRRTGRRPMIVPVIVEA